MGSSTKPLVVILVSDAFLGELYAAALGEQGCRTRVFSSLSSATSFLRRAHVALCILEIDITAASTQTWMKPLTEKAIPCLVICHGTCPLSARQRLTRAGIPYLSSLHAPPSVVARAALPFLRVPSPPIS